MKKNLFVIFPIMILLLTSCSTSKKTASIVSNTYSDSLTSTLNDFAKKSLIPGFSVAIVNDKEILYSKGFGYSNLKDRVAFTPLTINWVASISKTFVALSIMKLVEENKLNLDDPINTILPYKITNPHYPNIPITVRHLLTHTSTIIDDAFVPYYIGEADICLVNDSKEYDSLPKYMQPNLQYYRMGKKISLDENIRKYTQPKAKWYTDSTFLKKEPGTFFQYSNLGASIAARIVEIKSNMSFIDFTKKYIFEPLKMKNTAWNFEDLNQNLISKIYAQNDEQKPTGVVEHPQYYMTNYPVSGLKTNALDLSSYLIELIKGFEGKGKLLNSNSYQTLFKPQLNCEGLNKSDTSIFNDKYNIATLWSVSVTGVRLHFGGNNGVYAFIYFNPKTKKGALAYSNLRDNSFGEILKIVTKFESKMEND
ncbi:serine hydrolase domain-containing protein [Flavobacterium sp.]|uniref:serine hydrolase domain-containing protein n=1 Tax=Flavobacterium sp. TaxID=239 RepID=UPI002639BE8F|nr:serine hydrolase domain-containing protein [Flavobacterium sp.]